MNILGFWGKAQPRDPDSGPDWHPLAYHCLDVSAVGKELIQRHHGLRRSVSNLLNLEQEVVIPLICFLLCLHDVGKFAKKFQAKVPRFFPDCFDENPAALRTYYDHGAGGLRLFDAVTHIFGLPSDTVWRPLFSAVAGHHGMPPEARSNESERILRMDFGKPGIEASGKFIRQIKSVFSMKPEIPPLSDTAARSASHALAGLAVLADWIGSDQEWFPYCEPNKDLETYWAYSRNKAIEAVRSAGLLPAEVSSQYDYGTLFEGTPSPMQKWARSVELPDGPTLFMIEDETGSGKTEAALMLAYRLMADGRADGLYVALPTMATANAMFDRIAIMHRHLFAADSDPSVALVHGAREMNERFRPAGMRAGQTESPYTDEQGDASEITASTVCAEWIADDRRRAFLADIGIGTVDQALLSILPNRHHSLRLLGLMRRVLILDEVHAYDCYMQKEIETLLEFQAGLGGSAILLSATLPVSFRKRLSDAFTKGLGKRPADVPEPMDYPMTTIRARETSAAIKISARAERARALPVRFIGTPEEAFGEVEREAKAGKAVLYIRNSVDDVLDACNALAARGLTPMVFHARFALADRLDIEKRVVSSFGKTSTPQEREGKVLVATQVVEQSLDLDFDALITDLAPIDLLIQRAGRLWRHNERGREGSPEFLVVAPSLEASPDENWFSDVFPRAAHIYKDHGRLWLTAKKLKTAGVIESPGNLRSLIEAVYGTETDDLPEALQRHSLEAEGKAFGDRSVANTNVLSFKNGYVRNGGEWDNDLQTPTRLIEIPQTTLRLALVEDGSIVPYARKVLDLPPGESWRAWRLSEVNVSALRVDGEAVPGNFAEVAEAAKIADWTSYDMDKILILLEKNGGNLFVGTASSTKSGTRGEIEITYDATRGLIFA